MPSESICGSIAEMLIQLGRNLGLSVVAEGVEDPRQTQILHTLDGPTAQNFSSRALSPPALYEWLAESTPARIDWEYR